MAVDGQDFEILRATTDADNGYVPPLQVVVVEFAVIANHGDEGYFQNLFTKGFDHLLNMGDCVGVLTPGIRKNDNIGAGEVAPLD